MPPKGFIFFVDRSLGKKIIPDALKQFGVQIVIHDDVFPPDTKDEVWLKEVGEKGWVVLTKDDKIRYHPNEMAALIRAKVAAFILGCRKDLQGKEMAEIFVAGMPRMQETLKTRRPPFIAKISKSSEITVIWPAKIMKNKQH